MIYNQKVGLPIYVLTGFFVCIDFFQERDLFRKKEDIHLKPLTPGEALNHIPYIPKNVAGATRRSFTLTLKRCGVWDTVAVVVTGAFLLLFQHLKKKLLHTAEDESHYKYPLRRLSPPPLPKGEALNTASINT